MNVTEAVRGLSMFVIFFLALFWGSHAQNGVVNTTMNPLPSTSTLASVPFPAPTPPPTVPPVVPSTSPADMSSTTPSMWSCCYVQSACNNCTEVYNVNSISYCCPDCRGLVLVTDLVCKCYVPKGYQNPNLKCKWSNTVVGDYPALRPSYYSAGSDHLIYSFSALFLIMFIARVAL